jgi:hypothetical protein
MLSVGVAEALGGPMPVAQMLWRLHTHISSQQSKQIIRHPCYGQVTNRACGCVASQTQSRVVHNTHAARKMAKK